MGSISELEPKAVFQYFERLCAVPHGSGNTKQISDLCCAMAAELGLPFRQDGLNNVVIRKPGSPGRENDAPVILQGHLDMVCVAAPGSGIDLSVTGPVPLTDGEWVWADRSSLGGDDGIAVAMILAVLADDTLPHPPLEAVFTVDEEVGMEGAAGLDCSELRGRTLLNLDSEDEGVFTVSCAGGAAVRCTLPCAMSPCGALTAVTLTVEGLRGGHSGVEIDRGRGNAIALLSRVLRTAADSIPGLRLASLSGGRFDNVICPRCSAVVALPGADVPALRRLASEAEILFRQTLAGGDPEVRVSVAAAKADAAFSAAATRCIAATLCGIPQGVQAMSPELPGLVQTSLNLGSVTSDAEGVTLRLSVRSADDGERDALAEAVCDAVRRAGGETQVSGRYPGWKYAPVSPVRERVLAAYRAAAGKEGRVEAIHAGLECGLFAEKLPGLDAISIGPEIRSIHAVEERLNVASVRRLYQVVRQVLTETGHPAE